MVVVQEGEAFRFEHEHYWSDHRYGSDNGIPDGRIEIRRGSDGLYWDGATFDTPQAWLTTIVDGGGLFDFYDFTIPAGEDETYIVRMQHNDDAASEGLFHLVVRDLSGTGGADPVFDGTAFALNGVISFK